MFRYISQIIAQFSTPQKIIALSLILLSIVIITVAPSLIDDKSELEDEIVTKNEKIKELEINLNHKDSLIRREQKNCTNQIIEREKEFISMLDYLSNKAKRDNNKVISQTNMESFPIKVMRDSVLTSTPSHSSTIIVKNDTRNIINEIDKIKEKIKH
jgi:hypothetical protein